MPSGSCIFTLDVDNQTSHPVSVEANSAPLGTVSAHGTRRFYEMMDGNPPLPWSVGISYTSDGVALLEKYFPIGTLSGQITVSDEPHAIAAGYCP